MSKLDEYVKKTKVYFLCENEKEVDVLGEELDDLWAKLSPYEKQLCHNKTWWENACKQS